MTSVLMFLKTFQLRTNAMTNRLPTYTHIYKVNKASKLFKNLVKQIATFKVMVIK